MCKKCKENRKKKHQKFFKRARLGLGLFTGGALGMLFAPKKGREFRSYLNSSEFKNRLKKAKARAEDAKDYAHEKAVTAKNRFQRFWFAVRKRFGI